MNVGLWIVPAVWAGVFVILWAAIGLERFVTSPGLVRPIRQAADADHTDAAARPEVLGVARQPAAEVGSAPAQRRRRQACSSE